MVFGGLKGLEFSLDSDEHTKETDIASMFDHYINTCPSQGSRTIRTEVMIMRPCLCSVPPFCSTFEIIQHT